MSRWFICLGIASIMAACSQTVSASDDNEESSELSSSSQKKKSSSSESSDKKSSAKESDFKSSSSKGKNSSSSSAEKMDDDCAGEPGNPWDGTTAKDFACGAGTKLSPYIILTAEQLAKLSFVVGSNDSDYQGKYYKLGADIVLNEGKIIDDKGALVADSTKLHKWTPIGNSSVAFTGNFDGNNHTVSGMFVNTTSTHNGLFGNSSGTVQNVSLENSWVSGGKFTGGLAGYNTGTVEKLTNLASVSGKEECVGGVVGDSYQKNYSSNSVIKNVVNKGIVSGSSKVGGVAGCAANVTLDDAENLSPIDGVGFVGGVVGIIGNSSRNEFKNLKNNGKITAKHFVGGISGLCGGNASYSKESSSYSCIEGNKCGIYSNAYNQGTVAGKRYVGGISGVACSGTISSLGNVADIEGEYGTAGVVGSASYVTSKNLYNRGNIHGGDFVGGIFSYNKEGVTSAAYSTGKVDGDSLVGLMIGYNYNTTMADYYYLEQDEQEPFGLNNGGGVATPKAAKEMQSKDFAELLGDEFVYDSGLNDGFPVLKWEKE